MTEFIPVQFHARTLWTDPNPSRCNTKCSIRARKWGLINPKALLHFPKLGDTASAKASPLPPKPGCIPQNLSGAGMTRGEMETEVTRNASPPRAPSAVPSGCPWREHISNTQLYPWWETPQRFTGKISAYPSTEGSQELLTTTGIREVRCAQTICSRSSLVRAQHKRKLPLSGRPWWRQNQLTEQQLGSPMGQGHLRRERLHCCECQGSKGVPETNSSQGAKAD